MHNAHRFFVLNCDLNIRSRLGDYIAFKSKIGQYLQFERVTQIITRYMIDDMV